MSSVQPDAKPSSEVGGVSGSIRSKEALADGRMEQQSKERQISLRYTAAQLGGGVEGDTTAEALGQRIIDVIIRYWTNGLPVTTIIKKINGSLSPAEALSIIDVYAILFVAKNADLVKESRTRLDMQIGEFRQVFSAWKQGHSKTALHKLFPRIHTQNIDRLVRACTRRMEAELAKEQDVATEHREVPSDVKSLMAKLRALNIPTDLIRKLHHDDAQAVRSGEFMVIQNRPAYVLFLDGRKAKNIGLGDDGAASQVEEDVDKNEIKNIAIDAEEVEVVPEILPEVEEEIEVQVAAIEKVAEKIAEGNPSFDEPAKAKDLDVSAKVGGLKAQAEALRLLNNRRGSDKEVLKHASGFKFQGADPETQKLVDKDLKTK